MAPALEVVALLDTARLISPAQLAGCLHDTSYWILLHARDACVGERMKLGVLKHAQN